MFSTAATEIGGALAATEIGGALAVTEINGALAVTEIDGALAVTEIDGALAATEIGGGLAVTEIGEGFIAEGHDRESIRDGVITGIQGRTTDAFEVDDRAILTTMADGGIRSRGGSRRPPTTMRRPSMAIAATIGMIAALRTGVIATPITTVA